VSRVSITGVDKLITKVNVHYKKVQANQLTALRVAAVLVQSSAVRLVQKGPKTGRTYGDHQASAPGEPPATDTGNLVRNIGFEVDKDKMTATVASRAPYSAALEFGTNDGKILPRPFMMPAYLENEKDIKALLKEASRG
jgi:HK97 gp10 family phage protein